MSLGLALSGGGEKGAAHIGVLKVLDKMPLVIPSVNMCTGEVVCFISSKMRAFSDNTIFTNDAEIGNAVQASCSFPTVFSPCDYKGDKLIDVAFRSFELMSKELSKYELDGMDYSIKIRSKKVSLLDMQNCLTYKTFRVFGR